MRIKDINHFPFGTVISLNDTVPKNVLHAFLASKNGKLHKVKGTPSNIWTEILIDPTNDFSVGDEVKFLELA